MAQLTYAGPVVGQKNIAEPLNLGKDFFTVSGPSWNINEDKEENLIESVSVSNEPLHIQDKTAQAIRKPAALQDKVSTRVAEVEAAGTAQQQADFAVPVTQDQWRMISTAASQSDNPDEELQRYAAALTYGREYGVDTETALQNLNEFTMHQLGKPYSPTTTGVQAIANSFKVGKLNMRFNDLAYDLKQADLKGEDISGYLTELDSMATEIASLQDYQPRNIVTTALKWTMEGAVPYMIEVGKASLVGATFAGGLATAFTGATGIALGSLAAATPWTMAGIIAIGATVGAINRTRELEEGATYLNLRQMGVDKDIANVLSRTNAMVVGAIEAGLGIEAGTILKAVGGDTLASQVTSAVVAKLNTSGALGALANAAVSSTVGAGGEFIQEFTQEISDITHTYIAHAWQSMRTDMEPLPDESALKQALYAGYRGFVSAIVLGAASSVVNTSFDLRQQAKMKENAKANPSKEAFIASLKDSKPESVTGADWSEATSGIWEKAHKDQKQSTSIQSEEAAVNELDYGAGEKAKGSVRRLSTGELYTKEDGTPTTDTSGAEHHRLLVGDPATGARYGHIEYAISDNTLTINDVRVKSGYENIRQESILSLAKQYPGYDIQWEAKGENLQSIKDSIIESNPRGKDAGLQYFDGVTNVDERIKLEGQIKDAMPNLNASERALGATMIQLTAESQGKTTEAYLQASFRDGKLFGDTQEMDSAMQGKKGAVSFTNDLKAVIYAGEKADFSTFTHETFHVAMRNMGQTEQFRTAVTEASQTPEFITWLDDHAELFKDSVFDGKDAKGLAELAADFGSENWGRSHEEFAARLFEGYLADGKTASPKLQGLFKRIAEWMGRIYTTLKHSVALDPRIVEAFDSMLDADTPLSQAARESQDQERTSAQSKDTAQNLYQETDGQRQYDAVVSEYHGTEQWMKAPNGKDTNLNERQWVQVRTPSFISWFGDWMNDPENASKVVDENGEPKVVYHSTNKEFEIFDTSDKILDFTIPNNRGDNIGSFFTTSNRNSRYFGNKTIETFLSIKNPKIFKTQNDFRTFVKSNFKIKAETINTPTEYRNDTREVFENNNYDGVVIEKSEFGGKNSKESWYVAFSPTQIKSATDNIGTFDGENPNILFQEAPPDYQPKSTGIGYKVFVQKDGKLYPPMVANPNGEGTPVGKWLLADEAPIAAYSKTGRPQVKSGGKGTQGKSGLLAYRPGWHLGEIPYAKQFNRLNPATGNKELFPKDFVWAEVEYSKDNDYNDEARQNGVSKNGGFRHALASLYRMPTDGFYNYRTNPDPTTDPWVITGAMKVNKVLTQEEVDAIVKDAGREPQQVEQETQLNLYHGSGSSFDKFSTDFIGNGEGMQAFGWGIYLSESETVAKGYAKRIGEHGINNLSISGLDIFKDRWQTRYTIESDGKAKMDLIKIITEEQFSIYKALDKSMEDGLKYIQKVFDKAISNADTSMLEVLNKYRPNSVEDIKFEGIKGRYLYNASLSKGKELSEQAWLDWYEPVPVATIDMVTKALNESDIKKEQWEDRNVTGAEEYREKYLNGKDGNTLYVNIATLLDDEGGTREGSLFLAKAGIPGVRYPIGSISGKKVSETGKSNYVVFDDKSIDIKSTTLFQEAPPLDSQAFKAWFGDSKVVDENGEPLVVYHGTGSVFTEFDVEQSGKNFVGLGDYGFGIYFTQDPKYASKYAMGAKGTPNIIPAYLSMQNPLIVRKGSATKELERIAPHARTERELSNYVKELGYDGIIVNDGIGDNLYVHEAVVFSPTQIKSVNNQGTWDSANPNILFQESNEKRPLEKRVSNDYLLDVKDMIDEIIEVGGKVNDLGIITVYHATSKNSAEKIKKTGRMIAKEDGLFFSTKSDGQITGYGESVVKFEIPAELLIIDDIFEDEAHLVLELGNSRSKNIGMYDPSILFQEENREAITEQILEDARGFETWEGMKYYYESLYGTDMWGDALDEAYQSNEWYQAVFNEANGISETAAKAVDPQMSPEARLADEKQKDGYIKEKLSTDEGIKAFMEKLGWVLNVGFDRSSPSMEDRKMAETVQNLRETLPEMVHPTILSNAKRVGGGKTLTERAIKSIRTLMTGDGIRYYRDIYADVMEDPQLKPQVIDERLPSIESPGYNLTGFSITDRIKLADSIEAAPLKKAILSGKETLEGSAEKVIKVMDREIDDSNKQIEKLEQELKDMEDKLSESEMWHFHYAKQYSEASRSLDAEMKQIRKLTNDNMQVPEAQMKSATRLQAKVDLLHDQMMKNRASERVNATVKRHEALAELKEKLKEKQKTKDEAKKVRAYKLKLARKIMVKPSDAINYDQAQLIYNIQATLDPVFRQKSMELEIDGEQQRVTIDEAREALEGVSDEELQMAMGKRLYERIIGERKPLNDWTIEDLEQTLETVANLRTEGRAVLAAKMEQKQIIAQNYQDSIIRSLMATGKYTSQPLVGTKQDQKEKNHPINVARAFRYGTLAMRPKAMMLDNNTQGAAYKLLVTMKRAAQNAEWRAVERRMEPVFKVMKEYGITEKDLYKSVQISLGERMEEYTYSHLMYAWLSQFDESNRNAVAYGNLISKDEKIALDHDNDLIRELGDSRYRQLMDQVQYHLETQDESGGYMAVVKAVQEDFNAQAPRLNEIAIREFNKAMRVVEQYLPIHRKEFSGADMRQQVAEDLFNAKAGSNATGVAKGFQKDRIFISPDHQTPVNLDLMGVWNKSARQQEHFIAFAEYGRTLNRVFKNLGSRDLENAINRTLGKEMYQDVTEYINQIINPQPNNNLKGLEKGVKFMRGNLGAAYLTWKMGGLVLQAITSPMPYLSVIRADKLVKAYIGIFAHPIKSIEFINSKSAMMKNRTMNVIIDQILQESRTYTDNRLVRWNRKQQEIGSMGLTLVDRYAVAGGWLAAYEQKLNDLQSQGLVFADADAQAVIYADDIVLKTQPTGDATEIAPLFVTGSEFARAFTQFQTSLNVIWANLTYDMPKAFKKAADSSLPHEVRVQQFSQAIGTIVGYALAGALLGAVAEGHDEDDDAIDKLRNWIYWSFTQATASVPLVGDVVDNLVESAVTGDKPHVFSDEFFPGISKLFKGAVYLTQADIEKGLKNLVEGSGYMTGLPVSGYKQMKKAITEDPGALLGR